MRFNGAELAQSARLWDSQVEGVLAVKEMREHRFRRNDVEWVQRYCRLKGNLLLLFAGMHPVSTDVFAVVLLEQHQVQLAPDESTTFPFRVSFEAGDAPVTLCAPSEPERQRWMAAIASASAQALRDEMEQHRSQVQALSGVDPLSESVVAEEPLVLSVAAAGLATRGGLEAELRLDGLPAALCNDVCVVASVRPPVASDAVGCWRRVSCTELLQQRADSSGAEAHFRRALFLPDELLQQDACGQLRFSLLQAEAGGAFRALGLAQLAPEALRQAASGDATLCLELALAADVLHEGVVMLRLVLRERTAPSFARDRHALLLRQIGDKLQMRSFAFRRDPLDNVDAAVAGVLPVTEMLSELRVGLALPRQVVALAQSETQRLLGLLSGAAISAEEPLLQRLRALEQHLRGAALCLEGGRASAFKPSALKKSADLEFLPVNLHLHRTLVTDGGSAGGVARTPMLDVVTVGAFAAHTLKFRQGGLHSALLALSDEARVVQSAMLRGDALLAELDAALAELGNTADREPCAERVRESTQALLRLLQEPVLRRCCAGWPAAEPEAEAALVAAPGLLQAVLAVCARPDVAALGPGDALSQGVSDLSTGLCGAWRTALRHLASAWLREMAPLRDSLDAVLRRDWIVFSQALSAAMAALLARLSQWEERHWRAAQHAGVLLFFESLLSTYGDEWGMLEDMRAGVDALADVKLDVEVGPVGSAPYVRLISRYLLRLSVAPELLPERLREAGAPALRLRLYPVLLNVGINEQQTLADRLRMTSLQEEINRRGVERLLMYLTSLEQAGGTKQLQPAPACQQPAPLEPLDLEQHLQFELQRARDKPVELLRWAEQLAWLAGGLRLTNCKSGKDRTSMALTLEQQRWLATYHGLRPLASRLDRQDVLDCLRISGLRRDNCAKNMGRRRYAFATVQLLSFPKLYRPPKGTYSVGQT